MTEKEKAFLTPCLNEISNCWLWLQLGGDSGFELVFDRVMTGQVHDLLCRTYILNINYSGLIDFQRNLWSLQPVKIFFLQKAKLKVMVDHLVLLIYNKPTVTRVGAARMAQNIHKAEFILMFSKKLWLGIQCKETAYTGIRNRCLSIR